MTASELLDRHFLEVRARLLEIAATLDRIDRAGGGDDDPRRQQLHQGLQIVMSAAENRAEQIQHLFSRPYLDQWRDQFGLTSHGTSDSHARS